MKIMDLHADIGYDVMQKRAQGYKGDILQRFHMEKFHQGEIAYIGMASYFEGWEDWAYMQTMVSSLREEIEQCEAVDIVTRKKNLCNNGHVKAFLTIEGMCGIKDAAEEKIQWLYDQGIRIASLCWNDENALATGVKGNPERGLSEMGRRVVRKMKDLHMMVDVSHANEQTFWDILEEKAEVIATHSNAYALCPHPRNLTDAQLIALAQQGGIIGINSAPAFVHPQKMHQDIPHLVAHMKYLKELIGLSHVALGLDFMDFYDGYEDIHTQGLKTCAQCQTVIAEMERQGFTPEEIAGVAYQNALTRLQEVLN